MQRYGLSLLHGLTDKLAPMLMIQAQITDAAEDIRSQGGDRVMPLGGVGDTQKLDDILADQEVLANLLRISVDRAGDAHAIVVTNCKDATLRRRLLVTTSRSGETPPSSTAR